MTTILKRSIEQIFATRLNVVMRGCYQSQPTPVATAAPFEIEPEIRRLAADPPEEPSRPAARQEFAPGVGEAAWAIELLGEHRRDEIVTYQGVFRVFAEQYGEGRVLSCESGPLISTYMGWVQRGRQVQKGTHGMKVSSELLRILADIADKQGREDEAREIRGAAASYKTFTLFHINQTQPKELSRSRSRRTRR